MLKSFLYCLPPYTKGISFVCLSVHVVIKLVIVHANITVADEQISDGKHGFIKFTSRIMAIKRN